MVPKSSVDFTTAKSFEALDSEMEYDSEKSEDVWIISVNKPFGQTSVNFVKRPRHAKTDSTTLWWASIGSRIFMHRFERASINPMDTA